MLDTKIYLTAAYSNVRMCGLTGRAQQLRFVEFPTAVESLLQFPLKSAANQQNVN